MNRNYLLAGVITLFVSASTLLLSRVYHDQNNWPGAKASQRQSAKTIPENSNLLPHRSGSQQFVARGTGRVEGKSNTEDEAPRARVRGRVQLTDQSPVGELLLEAYSPTIGDASPTVLGKAITRPDGTFVIDLPIEWEGTQLQLKQRSNTRLGQDARSFPRDSWDDLVMTLPGCRLRILVINPDGTLATGAMVYAAPLPESKGQSSGVAPIAEKVGLGGVAELDVAKPMRLLLSAESEDGLSAVSGVDYNVTSGSTENRIELRLETPKHGRIHVYVVDKDGIAVSNYAVRIVPRARSGRPIYRSSGDYPLAVSPVPIGKYLVKLAPIYTGGVALYRERDYDEVKVAIGRPGDLKEIYFTVSLLAAIDFRLQASEPIAQGRFEYRHGGSTNSSWTPFSNLMTTDGRAAHVSDLVSSPGRYTTPPIKSGLYELRLISGPPPGIVQWKGSTNLIRGHVAGVVVDLRQEN